MAHLYWRLNISANAGSADFLAVAELKMFGTVGGANQCVGGTASASIFDTVGPRPAAEAFDGDANTRWSTPQGTITGWLAYRFASAVDVAQYSIQAHPSDYTRSPRSWALEYSDDGVSWTVFETRQNVTWTTNGQILTFTYAPSKARVSQVAAEILRINTAVNARTSQVAVEVLRINTGAKIRTSQVAVEVLRPNAAAATMSARPQISVCT